MLIERKNYEEVKENSLPTVKIDIRIDGILESQRTAVAFVLKTKAFENRAKKSGKEKEVNEALEEASKILTQAVKDVLNG